MPDSQSVLYPCSVRAQWWRLVQRDDLQRLMDEPNRILLIGGVSRQPRAVAAIEVASLDPEFVQEGRRGVPSLADSQ